MTQTRSQTASQTRTGFAKQRVVDNTGELLHDIIAYTNSSISRATWRGVATFWPENDPTCGPGRYNFPEIYLALSAAADTFATISVRIYTADPVTYKP